jgi:hypothetical protein
MSFLLLTAARAPQTGVKIGTNMATLSWYIAYFSGYLEREMDSEKRVEEKKRRQSTRAGASG